MVGGLEARCRVFFSQSPRSCRESRGLSRAVLQRVEQTIIKMSDIGLIGLAVMGENLVLNMESKGIPPPLCLDLAPPLFYCPSAAF